MKPRIILLGGCLVCALFLLATSLQATPLQADDLLFLDNGTLKVGLDREKGAAITWLSWDRYPKNMINLTDPGRLIQQSYYAGQSLNRKEDGQSKAWCPWPWNPIQGGGVGSWARLEQWKQLEDKSLYAETIPKLWDMPNEEATAIMRQWTNFEPSMPNVVVVRCEFVSQREVGDRWGPAVPRHQELPACYFTRNFHQVKSYRGKGEWREESQPPGPPWGKADPPRKSMACFNSEGVGIAIFSPASTERWNFGPHGQGLSSSPIAGPCMHVAPIAMAALGPKSTYRFRYWLIAGNQEQLEARLDELWEKYSAERSEVVSPQ